MPKIQRRTWMSKSKLKRVREILANCPDPAIKAIGLACLRGVEPNHNYLCRLIPRDSPERIAVMQYIESCDW